MTPLVGIRNVRKNYGGLRPLRMQSLDIAPGERVAISGLDAPAAELFVNLVTGASLPDEGTISAFGRPTSDITEGEAWLASLERFGIVSSRAALLEGSPLRHNLALQFTLSIDDPGPEVVERIRALAAECGIAEGDLDQPVGGVSPHVRARVHLARALALNPELLLVEHPTADVTEAERVPLARNFASAIERRGAAALIITMDLDFAEVAAHRSLALQPATGAFTPWKRKRGWFG